MERRMKYTLIHSYCNRDSKSTKERSKIYNKENDKTPEKGNLLSTF